MYASTWICTKTRHPSIEEEEKPFEPSTADSPPTKGKTRLSTLEEIDLGSPMMEEE